jgi:hypothetical protein
MMAANIHAELDALRADLHKSLEFERETSATKRAPRKDNDPAAKALGARTEAEEQLRELGEVLSESTGSIEDFVKEHQLASTLAAFVLGVAIGRLMGRA